MPYYISSKSIYNIENNKFSNNLINRVNYSIHTETMSKDPNRIYIPTDAKVSESNEYISNVDENYYSDEGKSYISITDCTLTYNNLKYTTSLESLGSELSNIYKIEPKISYNALSYYIPNDYKSGKVNRNEENLWDINVDFGEPNWNGFKDWASGDKWGTAHLDANENSTVFGAYTFNKLNFATSNECKPTRLGTFVGAKTSIDLNEVKQTKDFKYSIDENAKQITFEFSVLSSVTFTTHSGYQRSETPSYYSTTSFIAYFRKNNDTKYNIYEEKYYYDNFYVNIVFSISSKVTDDHLGNGNLSFALPNISLFNDGNIINESYNYIFISQKILSQYANGKEKAVIRCSVGATPFKAKQKSYSYGKWDENIEENVAENYFLYKGMQGKNVVSANVQGVIFEISDNLKTEILADGTIKIFPPEYHSTSEIDLMIINCEFSKLMCEVFDEVVPMIPKVAPSGAIVDVPLSKYQDGSPKVFVVVGSRMTYKGVVWQELTLQEKAQQ